MLNSSFTEEPIQQPPPNPISPTSKTFFSVKSSEKKFFSKINNPTADNDESNAKKTSVSS